MPYCDMGTSGLTGTVAVTILDAAGSVHVARTTAGISEPVAGSGMYFVAEHNGAETLTYVWDIGAGTQTASETLYAGRQGDAYAEAALVHAHVATIEADTNELQTDWADGGRLDLILDGIGLNVTEGTPQNMTASANTLDRGTAIQVDGASTGGVASTYAATYIDNASYLAFAPLSSTATVNGILTLGGFEQVTVLCGTKRASQVVVNGGMRGAGRWCDIYAYNYVSASWDKMTDSLTRINGAGSVIDANYTVSLLSAHQKNLAAGDGEVKIGFGTPSTTTGDRIALDQILIKAVAAGATTADIAAAVWEAGKYTKYDGHIWIDTVHGVAGTSLGVNGLPTYPVASHADAMILAAALPTHRLEIAAESALTLTSDVKGFDISGHGYKLALGGFDLSYAHVDGCEYMTGVATSADWEMFLWNCQLGACTLGEVDAHNCHITDLVTLGTTAPYLFSGCTGVPIGTPGIDFGSAVGASTVVMSNFAGVGTIKNMKTGDVLYVDGNCQLTLDATCVGGTVYLSGDVRLTNNGSGQTLHNSTPGTLEKLGRNRVDTSPATGVMTVYDNDGTTPLFAADVFEDVAGTVPYDGQSANRRNRLA